MSGNSTPSPKAAATSKTARKSRTSSATELKYKVEQSVPNDTKRRGPYAVKRTLDPNEVVIKRRFGEGSKPLFERPDIAINKSENPADETRTNRSDDTSSSDNERPERYRRRSSSQKRERPTSRRKPRSNSRTDEKEEKVPYFIDERREEDRIRRLYGKKSTTTTSGAESPTPAHTSQRSVPRRKHVPDHRHNREQSPSSSRHGSSNEHQRRHQHSRSSDRRKRSDSRSNDRCHSQPQRRSGDRDREQYGRAIVPAPQIIHVPVPVADYPYAYPVWSAPPQTWRGAAPTAHFAPYAPPPYAIPPYGPLPAYMPPLRPALPPFGVPPYGSRMFRPPRQQQQRRYMPRH